MSHKAILQYDTLNDCAVELKPHEYLNSEDVNRYAPMLTWADWELLQELHKDRAEVAPEPILEAVKHEPSAQELARTPLQLNGNDVRLHRGSLRPVHRYDEVDTKITVELVQRLMDEVTAAENAANDLKQAAADQTVEIKPKPSANHLEREIDALREQLKNAAAERDRALVQVTVYRKAYYNLLHALSAGPSLQAMLDAVRIIDAAVKDHENQ